MKKFACIILALIISLGTLPVLACRDLTASRTGYEISLTLNDDMTANCKVSVDFYNGTETALKNLKFNLYGNAFRKDAKYSPISLQYQSNAYPHGKSYGEMTNFTVESREDSLNFSITGEDKNILEVDLGGEVYPDERVKIEINYTLKLADVIARTGYNEKTINLANFYPILCVYDGGFYECNYYSSGDPFYSECADYEVSITANSDYLVAGSGRKQSTKTDGNLSTNRFVLRNARSFALVLSKEFKTLSKTHNGVMINYYYYGDPNPDKSMEFISKSLDFFGEKFGEYAYLDYTVVETKFVQGGMEFPTLVMISDSLEEDAYHEVIVHETAHQWWQSAVGNNEIEHAFLDEGLAEYSVVLFYEKFSEYGLKREVMIRSCEETYRTYCTVYDKIFGKINTSMIRKLNDFDSEYEYVNIAYMKSCLMLEYLRQTIGDNRFFNGLKRYYQNYAYKIATPDDFAGVFEKIGADTNGFFRSFFDGKVII